MPGILDSTRGNCSFIAAWQLHRGAIAAADDPAHPELITAVIDLSKSFKGIDSEIWICPNRLSGAGTVNMSLVLENNGTLAALQPYVSVATANAADSLVTQKFTGLVAGKYRLLLTTVPGASSWDVHYTYVVRK